MYLSRGESHPWGVVTVMAQSEGLSAVDAGSLIKQRRKERGLTQEQLVERTGLSSQSYLSALEKGRYHIGRSDHFGAIAKALMLSAEDIRAVNPSAVITLVAESRLSAVTSEPVKLPRELPQGLQAAIDTYGKRFDDLRDPKWQQYLAGFSWREGEPEDPEAWLDLYRDLTRAGIIPIEICG